MDSRWRARPYAAVRWWASLDTRPSAPRPAGLLAAVLAVVPVVCGAAMPLVWHHLTVPNPAYSGPPIVEIIHGTDTGSWLIAVAALAVVLAVRALRDAPGLVGIWVVTALAVATVDGMFIDWFDWSIRGVSLTVPA